MQREQKSISHSKRNWVKLFGTHMDLVLYPRRNAWRSHCERNRERGSHVTNSAGNETGGPSAGFRHDGVCSSGLKVELDRK